MAMTKEESEAGNVVINFGKKHNKEPLWLVVDTDPEYVDWLVDQDWLKKPKYEDFYKKFLMYTQTADIQAKLHNVAPARPTSYNTQPRPRTRL